MSEEIKVISIWFYACGWRYFWVLGEGFCPSSQAPTPNRYVASLQSNDKKSVGHWGGTGCAPSVLAAKAPDPIGYSTGM
ncbi:MAG: hypothetical protein Q8O09_05030 [Bacillota bacterium]|nr:hypothetical protein [Bacillota bacterium]